MNYYNEFDPKAAAWLRELIKEKLIPNGVVDERSITEVSPSDLSGYTQCHFFAGIGGWSYALRLANWPEDKPVWTGSCPCQPFSVAGKGLGEADERHLWPVFFNLIKQCQPPVVFGEQVASKAGREWLSGVFADLETLAYRRAGADLCAAGVGAPHIRQRLFWVAESQSERWRTGPVLHEAGGGSVVSGCGDGGLVFSNGSGRESGIAAVASTRHGGSAVATGGDGFWSAYLIPCADGKARRIEPGTFPLAHGVPGRVGLLRGYGNAIVPQVAQVFIEAYLESN